MKTKTVSSFGDEYTFVDRDYEIDELNKEYNTEYGSFFVKVGNAEYDEVWGMYGFIPYNDKNAYQVYIRPVKKFMYQVNYGLKKYKFESHIWAVADNIQDVEQHFKDNIMSRHDVDKRSGKVTWYSIVELCPIHSDSNLNIGDQWLQEKNFTQIYWSAEDESHRS